MHLQSNTVSKTLVHSRLISLVAITVSSIINPYLPESYAQHDEHAPAGTPKTSPYVGDLNQRLALTGDWGGSRTRWLHKGVSFELNATNTYQSVVDGGIDTNSEFGGSVDLTLNLDFGKLGWWKGGSLRIKGEGQYGDSIIQDTGTLIAPNIDALFPVPEADDVTLTEFLYTQLLSHHFGFFVGKMSVLSGDANVFSDDDNKKFLNHALGVNAALLSASPYSALGAGLIIVPKPNIHLVLSILDAEGTSDKSGFDTVFEGGSVFGAELAIATKFGGKAGHHTFGALFNSREYTSLNVDPRFQIPSGIELSLRKESDSWALYYNFDQFIKVEEEDPTQGWGIFGRIGFADEDTSPIKAFYSFGFGGKGIIPGRDNDTFGLGFYYADPSDEFTGKSVEGSIDIDTGFGAELFYNFEVKPWMHITPDIQVLDSGFGGVDTAVVLGLRSRIDF
jgi:porin